MTFTAWFDAYDDIRIEANGKETRIGCYTGSIVVSQFPTTIPQLVFAISVRAPLGTPVRNLRISITRPGQADFVFDPQVNPALQQLGIEGLPNSVDATYSLIRLNVPIRPCAFERSGRMKVHVTLNDETVNAGGIMVESAVDITARMPPDPFVATIANITAKTDAQASKALKAFCADYIAAWERRGFNLHDAKQSVINFMPSMNRMRSALVHPLDVQPDSAEVSNLPDGITANLIQLDKYGATFEIVPPTDLPPVVTVTFKTKEGKIA